MISDKLGELVRLGTKLGEKVTKDGADGKFGSGTHLPK